MKVVVELGRNHPLVLAINVAEHVMSSRQGKRIDGFAVVELGANLRKQLRERIRRSPDRKALRAAAQRPKAALDGVPVSRRIHLDLVNVSLEG
jgi:hypothetical protein